MVRNGGYFYFKNLQSMVKFMPRRLLEVIEKASNTTKYNAEGQYTIPALFRVKIVSI